jgi:hypothetical protein
MINITVCIYVHNHTLQGYIMASLFHSSNEQICTILLDENVLTYVG